MTEEGHRHGGLDYLSELPQARPHIHETRKFPQGFLWGSSTSSYQVEGGNVKSDWHEWEHQKGHVLDGSNAEMADDHYRQFEQDFDIVQDLNQNAHRLSIEWSRIEPEEGKWDMDEVMHYRRVLESLKRRGISTMVTCWHFTLPVWFQDRGGWEAGDATKIFARYAAFLATELGDLTDLWLTMNEPMIYLAQSYGTGVWPPGKASIPALIHVFGKLCIAHRAAYKEMHAVLDAKLGHPAQIGIAQNVITFEAYRKYSFGDLFFVWFADKVYNRQFFIWTAGCHDFIGINYYFHYRIKYRPTKIAQFFFEVHAEDREVSDLGWEINSPALFEALTSMARYKKPIYITEHGVADADDGKRPRVIVSALKEVYHAIRAGIDVRGYFHWSLLDNFEWEKGLSGRFGLVAVDYATQKRTPRRSAYVYAEICKENGITHNLLRFLGHGVRW